MDKDQYTAKSKKKDLPPRCPLIGFCYRWAQTIFFYQYYDSKSYMNKSIYYIQRLSKDGIIQDDFDDNKIEVIG